MALIKCPACGRAVSSSKTVCPYCGYNLKQTASGGALLLVALVLAIIFAPIIVVLGLFGKFLLKGLYKNILEIEEFKKFRKTYSVICLGWFVASIAFVVLCIVLHLEALSELSFYVLCGGNIALFVLSIVFGNKIYKKHKDEIPANPTEAAGDDSEEENSENGDAADLGSEMYGDDESPDGSNEYSNKKKTFELLAELASLRDANVLTEEEFNRQKQQILSASYTAAPKTVAPATASGKKPTSKVQGNTASDKKATAEKKEKKPINKKAVRTVIIVFVSVLVVGGLVTGIVFLARHRHSYEIEIVPPTCEEEGYTKHVCKCGEWYRDETVESTGHTFENGLCINCDYSALKYELSSTFDSYIYNGGATEGDVVILSEYNGKPVTGIGENAFRGYTGLTSVTIPDSVTSIGDSAFSGCSGLTSITIPDSVTSIGSSAFRDCTGLTSIIIPDSVTTIGDSAFYGSVIEVATVPASVSKSIPVDTIKEVIFTTGEIPEEALRGARKLTTVKIMRNVTSIGERAFMDCESLTNVIFDEGSQLAIIKSGAFTQCYALASITIPASVTTMGWTPFYNCNSLERVDIYDLAAWCNFNFETSDSNPLYYAGHLYLDGEEITELVIPESVTAVSDYAFYGCTGLTGITIPESVTSIGFWAFRGCTGVTSLTIPDTVTSIDIGAFDCGNLTSVTCPAHALPTISSAETVVITSGEVIESSALAYWSSLTSITIPDTITSIGASAFCGCTGLTSITIPDSVTSIGTSAFRDCAGLTSITISDSVTSIGDDAFYGCTGLTSVTCPASALSSIPKGNLETVVIISGDTIDNNAFRNCTALTSITIPSSVKSIGDSAFYGCSGLTSITLPDSVTSIGASAFYNCTGLTSITIPSNVTSIGDYAFFGCTGLTSVTFGNGVESIGDYAFYGCTGLTSITIPGSVRGIGEYAFSGCTGLTDVTIGNGVESIDDSAFSFCKRVTYVSCPAFALSHIPKDSLETVVITSGEAIVDRALYNCATLTSITIPDSVKSIGVYAFNGCIGLTSITLPDSVTTIGDYAFYYCSGLASITIPGTVQSIGKAAFYECVGLESVTFGNGLTSIGNSAFYNCSGLTSITIPDSVTSIGTGAFSGCSLTSVTCPAFALSEISRSRLETVVITSGETIRDSEFFGISSLTSITIPISVKSIGDSAFYGCTGLTSVTIPDSVTSIGTSAFRDCTGLTSVTIGNGVESIGNSAFNGCTGLTSVTIPDSVTSIGGFAFYGCTGLTSATIGNGVESIGEHAFGGCVNLTNVVIGKKVESIGEGAFNDCTALTGIIIPASVTVISDTIFFRCSNLTVYCEAAEKPSGWVDDWNYYGPVVWGYTGE